jgi:hypothetical protein
MMRKLALVVAAAAFFVIPTSVFSQSIQVGPGGVRVDDGRDRGRRVRGDMCRQLRAACLNKERLGEQGEGNCRRYRQTCR